ncbi:MAG: cyclomaltodextrinase N-terminal domain-containing protein, partial [Muribaculaceae bacterium]|nr:cyclomaltodextrinase N-terminal domain-containing protein [Muribaculaceae bacterium]
MKKFLLLLATIMAAVASHAAVKVDRIEPTTWFVGLDDPSVQLMVYGEGIRDAEVTIDYAGVVIDSLVRLDSPNYLLVYLNTRGAQPGTMEMTFKQGR